MTTSATRAAWWWSRDRPIKWSIKQKLFFCGSIMWEILAAQDLWSELSSNVSYYCMNELRGWNGSLIKEIKHTCNHSRGAQLVPAPLEFDSAATRSWIITNSWTLNKLTAAQIYAREPEIHAEKNQCRDTAPQRKISFLPEHRRRQKQTRTAARARIRFDQSAPHDRIVSRLHGWEL